MQLNSKRKIDKEIYRMFAGDSQMLRNKRHFVISLIAINMFSVLIFDDSILICFEYSIKEKNN